MADTVSLRISHLSLYSMPSYRHSMYLDKPSLTIFCRSFVVSHLLMRLSEPFARMLHMLVIEVSFGCHCEL